MSAAIEGARTLTRLDHLSKAIWQALAAGAVGDDDAQSLAERLHARRSVLRGDLKPVGLPPGRPSIFPPRRLQRAPKRPIAIARRRHLAASGPMPPALACKFTVSELAVLRVVGDEGRQYGHCDRCVDELAARAGVCRSMVKNAIRTASRLGLLTVEERRREGRRNLPNVTRIVSKEWTVWLARGGRSSPPKAEAPIGCKKYAPRIAKIKKTRHTRQNRSLLPEGSRRVRQCTIGKDGALAEESIRVASDGTYGGRTPGLGAQLRAIWSLCGDSRACLRHAGLPRTRIVMMSPLVLLTQHPNCERLERARRRLCPLPRPLRAGRSNERPSPESSCPAARGGSAVAQRSRSE